MEDLVTMFSPDVRSCEITTVSGERPHNQTRKNDEGVRKTKVLRGLAAPSTRKSLEYSQIFYRGREVITAEKAPGRARPD